MKKLKPILILLFVLFTSLKAIGQSLTYTFIDPCTKDVTYFSIPIQSGGGTTIFFLGQQRYFTANDVASGVFSSWVNQTYTDYRKVSPCGVQQARVTQNQITSQIIGSTIQSVVGSIMSQAKSESNSSTDGSLVSEGNNNSKDNKKSKNGKNNSNGGSNNPSNNSGGNGSNSTGGGNQTNSNSSTTTNTTTSSSSNTTTSSSSNTTTSSSSNTTNSGSSSGGNGSNNSGSSQNGAASGSPSTQNGAASGSPSTQGNGQGNGKTSGNSNSSTIQTGGQTGGQAGGQAGGQGSGSNTTKTEGSEVAGTVTMTTDANNDRGTGGSKNGKGGGRNNPVIISSDLTNAQNLDRSYTGIINVGMSQSSMTGTSSWGVNSMIWFNFRQFALTGRYTKIHYSKSHKLKLIHNVNLTGVYSYGNTLGFLGYSAILNAGKWGVTGINISGAVTKTPDDENLFMSPSATAFYTKPFKVGKRLILSPELYVISTPLIYSSVDKVSVSDRTFSAFIGTGVDYQISKRFKVNMNYKLNMSTNPDFPILSFFLIGSKVNL
jgi:hypothetical protein